jgi:hypothetical protein
VHHWQLTAGVTMMSAMTVLLSCHYVQVAWAKTYANAGGKLVLDSDSRPNRDQNRPGGRESGSLH